MFGITPDITTLGKVIGGGLPVAAYGGRRDIMRHVAPAGTMYQAGTLSGNPLAMAAGLAMLRELERPGVYEQLSTAARRLADAVRAAARNEGIAVQSCSVGSMWGFFFADRVVRDYDDAKAADTARYARFFHALLGRGVYLAPSQFEAAFVSTAHTDDVLAETERAIGEAMRAATA
jgi:glutamate-1-semialdehyde 2,1-aminomutase